ncbi:hypothetical protein EK21DRAFT_107098 [Setomelanomma holmii]|uniref:BTB domain-containing protein n=1 Tax=Setomelanomma holmii TaxID=210430 RepID=A0A9P4HKB0_9PLEO|nr:hypothetical protein EK21DRAFT_107098 [Setomelanomma holmii]
MAEADDSAVQLNLPQLNTAIGGAFVTVKVSAKGKAYHIHKPLLVHHSEYFRGARRGSCEEVRDGVVTLGDVEPGIFKYLYRMALQGPSTRSLRQMARDHRASSTKNIWMENNLEIVLSALKAYLLGDGLLAPAFRAAVWNESPKCQMEPDTDTRMDSFFKVVQFVYKNDPKESIVLQFLIDTFCKDWFHSEDHVFHITAENNLAHAFLL